MMAGYQTLFIYGLRASQQFEALRVKFSFRHDGIILDRTTSVPQPDSGLWKYQEAGTPTISAMRLRPLQPRNHLVRHRDECSSYAAL
jgi:hypothetical protein